VKVGARQAGHCVLIFSCRDRDVSSYQPVVGLKFILFPFGWSPALATISSVGRAARGLLPARSPLPAAGWRSSLTLPGRGWAALSSASASAASSAALCEEDAGNGNADEDQNERARSRCRAQDAAILLQT